jgi:hypothetical protein
MESFTEIIQVVTALGTMCTVLLGIRNAIKLSRTQANVQKIEIATNSMKDALVSSTAAASHAEGRAEGNKEGRADQTAERQAQKGDRPT